MVKKADIILVVLIVATTIAVICIFPVFYDDGRTVKVTVNGSVYGTYSIDNDKTIEVVTEYGKNVIEIKNKKVSITYADCPDKYCVSHVSITDSYQTIVCLPHRLAIEIVGD